MSFSIQFIDESIDELQPGEKASYGLIKIGSFQERFIVPLNFWSKTDYTQQWAEGIKRLTHFGTESCLITAMYDPSIANFITWWPMYRDGRLVHIQNQALFLDKLSKPFNPKDPYVYIPARETVNEDGERISEWDTSIADMKSFISEEE